MKTIVHALIAVALFLTTATSSAGDTGLVQPVLTSFDFNIVGVGLRVAPEYQAIPKGVASKVNASFEAAGFNLADVVAQLPTEYRVRAELSGPAFQTPMLLVTKPGTAFDLPTLAVTGRYTLANIRLVDGNGATLFGAVPQVVAIESIPDPLITSVTTRQLTVQELQDRGVTFDKSNFTAYEFTAAIATSSGQVPLTLPVVIPTSNQTLQQTPLVEAPSTISLPQPTAITLPPDVPETALPQNLEVKPFMMEVQNSDNVDKTQLPRIPGVIVIPGNIGFLHQYFSALALVSNGAPLQSGLSIRDVQAVISFPSGEDLIPGSDDAPGDDPLRMAKGQNGYFPRVMPVMNAGADGKAGTSDDTGVMQAGESGQADYTIEGLKEGTHEVDFDITAVLDGLPIGPVTLKGKASGAVLVRNPDFSVTLGHPTTVRAGEEYDLFITVSNTGTNLANMVSVSLDPRALSGAVFVAGEANSKSIDTIFPGSAATVKFRLKSQRTGAVTATAFESSYVAGRFILRAGVGEKSIPLSPDSLILPYTGALPADLVVSAVGLLGQAWSVATAPTGALPASVLPISKQTVTSRAYDLSESGLRILIGDDQIKAVTDMTFDFFGSDVYNRGFDTLRRSSTMGFDLTRAIGNVFKPGIEQSGVILFQNALAEKVSYRPGHLSIINSSAPVRFRLTDASGNRSGGMTADENNRAIPYADNIVIGENGGNRTNLILATRLDSSLYALELTAEAAATFDLCVVQPDAAGVLTQYIFAGVTLVAGATGNVTIQPGTATMLLRLDDNNDGVVDRTLMPSQIISIPDHAPHIVAATQLTPGFGPGGDKHGRNVAVLFSGRVTKESAQQSVNYSVGENLVKQATLQPGNRMAFLLLRDGIGPFFGRTLTAQALGDQSGKTMAQAETLPIRITASGPAAVVTGTVRTARGEPVPDATVRLYQLVWYDDGFTIEQRYALFTEKQASSDGSYRLEYVLLNDDPVGPFQIEVVNPVTGETGVLTTGVMFHGQRLQLDIFMKAKGNLSGLVRNEAGNPVAGAAVQVVSLTDSRGQSGVTDASGAFSFSGMMVGAYSLKAVSQATLSEGSCMGVLPEDGAAVTQDVTVRRVGDIARGTVAGTVLGADNVTPRSGIIAIIEGPNYQNWQRTAADGSFSFSNVYAGTIKVTARDDSSGEQSESGGVISSSGQILTLNVIMKGSGSVAGHVKRDDGKSAEGLSVVIRPSQGQPRVLLSDAVGSFQVDNVPLGNVDVEIIDPHDFNRTVASGTVTILAAGTTANIVLFVPLKAMAVGTIQGVVYHRNGTPWANAPLKRVVDTSHYYSLQADSSGNFTISGLPLGGYTLTVVAGSEVINAATDLWYDTQVRTLELRPVAIGSVTGITWDDAAKTVPTGSDVTLYSTKPNVVGQLVYDTGNPVVVRSDPRTGRFTFTGVLQGNFTVSSSNVFRPVPVLAGGKIEAQGQVVNLDLSLRGTPSVPGGPPPVNQPGSVSGEVLMPDGSAAAKDVRVTLTFGGADVTVTTDEQGLFHFAPIIPAGNQPITAEDPATTLKWKGAVSVPSGLDVPITVKLLGRGSVAVTVFNVDGAPAQGATVGIGGVGYPNDSANGVTDGTGQVSFANLSEGSYAVSATGTFGRGGRSQIFIPADKANVTVVVTLSPSATVTGRFLKADGVTSIAGGQIVLKRNGQAIAYASSSSDSSDPGHYRVEYVPLGDFVVEGYDPVTERRGVGGGRLNSDEETVVADVVVTPRGSVKGTVLNYGGSTPIAAAPITISFNGGSYLSVTGPDGTFLFTGIAAGQFLLDAADPSNGLYGHVNGSLTYENETVSVLVRIAPVGSISGRVFLPDGITALTTATVRLNNTPPTPVDTVTGIFRYDNLAAGQSYTLASFQPGTRRTGSSIATVNHDLEVVNGDITLCGIGVVGGTVFESDGLTPLPAAAIKLSFGGEQLTVYSDSNGSFSFSDIPTGSFTLSASHPLRSTGASQSGYLGGEGETITQNLVLGPIGSVRATVLLPDGVTPSRGGGIRISTDTGRILTGITDSSGQYTFTGIPVPCTISLYVEDAAGVGIGKAYGVLDHDGQLLDLGTTVLDDKPIFVTGINPAGGAVNVPVDQKMRVLFSEASDPDTVNNSSIFLALGSSRVDGTLQPDVDNSGVTFTPAAPLKGFTLYTLVVTDGVTDRAGRKLAVPQSISFMTMDTIPPVVTAVFPADGTLQVTADAVVRMTFSETVDPVSLNGIVLSSGGTPVSIRSDLIQNGTVVALTPLEPLGLNRTFTVSAAGVKDMAGNMMGGMAQAAFNTIDTIVPTVTAITVPSSADLIKGNSVPVTALVADNDVAFVDFYADDARIGTVSQAPYTHSLTLSHEGVIHLKAVAQDRVGNRGVPQTLELDVKVDMPPQIAIITPTDGSSVNTGGAIAVTVQWNDDLNLMEFVLTVSGELTVSQTIPVNGKSGSASFVLTAPAGITSTGAITIAVAARDSAGNVSKTAQRTVQLHDSIAPTITLASPGRDVKYKPGENAEVTITATDNIGLESIVCTADNAASKTMTFLVSPSVQSASRTFSFAVPNDAAPCATITVACSVRDRSGNSSIDTLLLTVADVVPPTVVSVTPAPGSTSVPVGSAVSVSFNEQIAPSSVTADLVSLTSIDGPVSGALSVASDGLTLTFKPYNQLGFARAYTFTLKAGVRDISGNAITSDLTVSFTTQRLDSDIVGYWPMDGDWSDYSGNGNHGTANGGVSFTSDRVVGTQAGSFDGVSGYVEIKNSSSLNPSAITVEAWVRSNASVWNSDGSLISKRDVYILHPIKDSREIRFFVFAGGNWPSVSCNDVNMDITKWHHYVSTYDGTVIKMYVDGVLKGTTNYSGSINTSDTGSLYVGWDDGISGRYFDGTIDEITIYKRALLPEDVLEHYNAGLTTNHTPPAAPTVDPVPLSTFSSQVVLRGAKESGSSIRVNGKQIVPHDAGTSWQALYTLVLGQNILDVSSHDPAGNISPAVSLVVDLLPINRKDPSIAGLWHMDGDWKDYSGNGNDLSGVNAIASSYDSPFPGMSAGFTGSASYLRSASGSRLPLGSSPRTISAWIKPYGYPDATYNGIFVYGPRNCNSATMLSIKNDGRLSTAFWCNDSYQTVGPTAPLNEWTHVAMTYDTGNKIGFYINGQLVQENTLSDTPVTQDGPIGIGATDDPGRFFNGLIDDVALYGRALGAQEILDIFNAKSSLSMVSPGQTQMYKPGDFGLATVSVSNPNGITKLYCNASGAVSEGTLVVPFDPPQTDVIQQFTFRVASNASPYALLHLSCIAETVAGTFGITDLDLQAADVTPAVVTGASIADNASGVAVTLPITVTFNKALLATSITSDTVQLRRVDSGAVVAGTIALSVDGTTITFTPALALDCSTSYHFVIQSVSDLVGNNSDYSIVFSTQTLVSPLIEDQGSSRVPYVLASGKYGTVTVSNSYVVVDGPVVADSISLSNSTITHYVNGLTGAEKLELAVAGTMSIDVASRIDVTGKGYLGSQGGSSSVGRTNGNTTTGGSGGGAGGSYGGYGGRYYYGYAAPNAVYGDPANPTEPGSGGGGMIYSYGKGGNGGGVVTIKAGILLLDGRITADGSSGGYVSGGGSGGGIRIDVGTLSGTGRISASGGWNSSNDEGGAGGGGRIAIYYGINTLPVANISAFGGKWYNGGTLSGNGGAGTIYLKDNAKTNPDLIVNYGSIATSVAATPVPGGDYDAVTVKGGAVLFMNSGLSTVTPMVLTNSNVTIAGGLVVSGDLILDNSHLNVDADAVLSANLVLTNSSLGVSGGLKIPGSMSMTNSYLVLKDILQVTGTISLQNGSTLTHESASKMSQWKLDITASSLSIDTTSKIDVTGRGYLSGSVGRTYGNSLDGGSTNYSGASYGGYGGGLNGGVVNAVYGDFTNPNEVGSGGGGYEYSSGDGGGLVRILTGNLALDGSIIADGQTSYYGGGSGGGIRIDADVLSGTGYVYARGGGSWYDFGAGGGGRIAVYYGLLTLPVANIVASGAASSYPGGAGTIYLKDNARPFADLIINNNGINSSSGSTPLTSIGRGTSSVLTYDSLIVNGLHWAPGALIGMRINPNINQSGFFKIVDNTTDTIFIDPAEGYLNQFATVGDSFSGVFALNSLSVLGKARLYTDEQFNVVGDAQIDNATVVAAELYAGRTLLTNGGLFEKR